MSIDAQLSHGEKVRRTLMSIDSGLTVGRGPVPRQRRYHRKRIETREVSPTAAAPHSVEQDRLILLGSRNKILLRGTGPRATVRTETNPENLAHLVNPALRR